MLYHNFNKNGSAFHSIDEEIIDKQKGLQKVLTVAKNFPDAQSEYCTDELSETLNYFSSSVKNRNDLQIEFSKFFWDTLHFRFYVELPFEDGSVVVYEKPRGHSLSVWDDVKLREIPNQSQIMWNHIDQRIINEGYDEKFIKMIFDELLNLMSEGNHLFANVVIVNKHEMPEYITNKLIFI